MTPRAHIGMIVLAAGVVAFMLALFGWFRELSLVVAAAGLVAIVVAACILLSALRGTGLARPSVSLVATCVAGLALHAYEGTRATGPFPIGGLAWSLVPYALCLVVGAVPALRHPALAGAIVVALVDAYVHYSVFVAPTSSTAALALLFAPVWNTLVFAPVAMLATWASARRV